MSCEMAVWSENVQWLGKKNRFTPLLRHIFVMKLFPKTITGPLHAQNKGACDWWVNIWLVKCDWLRTITVYTPLCLRFVSVHQYCLRFLLLFLRSRPTVGMLIGRVSATIWVLSLCQTARLVHRMWIYSGTINSFWRSKSLAIATTKTTSLRHTMVAFVVTKFRLTLLYQINSTHLQLQMWWQAMDVIPTKTCVHTVSTKNTQHFVTNILISVLFSDVCVHVYI